jgi:hypothetical protein
MPTWVCHKCGEIFQDAEAIVEHMQVICPLDAAMIRIMDKAQRLNQPLPIVIVGN